MTLSYTETGDGDPVVLLDWSPWDSGALAATLSSAFRVISVAPPDFVGAPPTEDEVVGAIEQVTEEAGLATFSLGGASLGARASFGIALRKPQAVSSLILVSPSFVEPASVPPWGSPDLAMKLMSAHPDNCTPPPPDRTRLLWQLAEQWGKADSSAVDLLPNLTCATLVVLGQEDRTVSRAAGGVWKDRVPNCSISYVYDAGHAIGTDRPEALANVVRDFIVRRETFIIENRSSLMTP